MREQGLAARRKKRRRATTRPGKGRWRAPDLVRRDFPAARSTASGTATAPRSPPARASSPGLGDGHGLPAGAGVRAAASIMTRSWPTARWPWRWRCAAARCPASSCTPTRAASTPPGLFRQACAPAVGPPVDGPARVRAGQRGHRVLALHPGVRAARGWSTSPPGQQPGPGSRPGSRTTTAPPALRAGHDDPGPATSRHWSREGSLKMPAASPPPSDRPVLGPVKVVPPRGLRPCGGSTWTAPALRRYMAATKKQGQSKISQIEVSTLSGEPRRMDRANVEAGVQHSHWHGDVLPIVAAGSVGLVG